MPDLSVSSSHGRPIRALSCGDDRRHPDPGSPTRPVRPAAGRSRPAIVALRDFEAPARERGSTRPPGRTTRAAPGTSTPLRDNLAAWDRYRLRPRVLVDVSAVDPSTTILGRPAALPIGIAPAALHGLAHPDGERATARAAAAAGRRCQVVSTVSSRAARGDRRGGARRPALVPAVRPARPGPQPGARRARRGRRLRGDLPDRRPAGARLPRRPAPARRSTPARTPTGTCPSATSGGPAASSTSCSTCGASALTWDTPRRDPLAGRRCRSCSRAS